MTESAEELAAAPFNYEGIPLGYYDEMMKTGHPIRRCWHRQKFQRVIAALPEGENLSILDIGCFAGTFLSMLPREPFSRQLGVDILPRQIRWANETYGSEWREFREIRTLDGLSDLDEQFDRITLIEVLEHLDANDIRRVLDQVSRLLKPGGYFILTTPNYASTWPILEVILNRISDVSYEEQHLTKFRYSKFEEMIRRISPDFDAGVELDIKTTSHFISPFLGLFSERLAMGVSRLREPMRWRLSLGNLILARFRRNDERTPP